MKLLACHIDNFGKLSDFSMDFSEGMNLILEENGWGKTTLAAFLKVMFYGCDSRKDPGAYEKERRIYQPWQGGVYGGTLDFEVDGRGYRISRKFGRTEKSDIFRLYDLDTMLESADYSSNLGVELFDLDSASFKRSIFIGQNDCTCTSTDGIHAKLGNLVENTNDINNYETAHTKLKDALNHLSPTRATGSIRRRRQQIERLGMEIKNLDAAQEGYLRLTGLQQEKCKEREDLLASRKQYTLELEKVSKESAVLEKKAQYEDLLADERQQELLLKEYQEQFPAGVPDEDNLRKLTGTVRQIAEAEARVRNLEADEEKIQEYERLSERFPDGVPEEQEITDHIEKQRTYASIKEQLIADHQSESELERQLESEPQSAGNAVKAAPAIGNVLGVILVVLALLGLAAGVVIRIWFPLFTYAIYAPAAGLILAGILCIIATVLFQLGGKQKNKNQQQAQEMQDELTREREEKEAPLTQLREKISEEETQMKELEEDIQQFLLTYHKETQPDQFISELYNLSADTEHYGRLRQTQDALTGAQEERQHLQEQADAFAQRYQIKMQDDLAAALSDIQEKVTQYRIVQQSHERALWKRQQFEAQNDMTQIAGNTLGGHTVDSVNEAIHELDVQLDAVRDAIEQYNRQIEDLQQQIDQRQEREEELRCSQELQEKEQHRYEIMDLTQEYLQKAKERFTSQYRAPISDGFRKYYHMLLEKVPEDGKIAADRQSEKPDDWQIDANMQFGKREGGQLREPRELSRGYQDLIGICMRLALADAMYQDEKPFLILDDPFVNLDEDKVKAAKSMMREVAQEYQVIYFTCHPSRIPEEAVS